MSLGVYEAGLRSNYQAARQRLFNSPSPPRPTPAPVTTTVAVKPPPVVEDPVAKPKTRPREHYVCTSLTERFKAKWIRDIIIEVSERRKVPALLVAGCSQVKRCVAARNEVWATLNKLGVSAQRLGVLFNKDHTTVLYGIRRHNGEMPWNIKQSSGAYKK